MKFNDKSALCECTSSQKDVAVCSRNRLVASGYQLNKRGVLYEPLAFMTTIGKNVVFFPMLSYFFFENIGIGNDLQINHGANFETWIAKLHIGKKNFLNPMLPLAGRIFLL